MRQPLGVQPCSGARLVEQLDSALLKHAGADAAQHVLAARPLEDNGLDADAGEQLPEQQARRSRTDDDDLSAHHIPLCLTLLVQKSSETACVISL